MRKLIVISGSIGLLLLSGCQDSDSDNGFGTNGSGPGDDGATDGGSGDGGDGSGDDGSGGDSGGTGDGTESSGDDGTGGTGTSGDDGGTGSADTSSGAGTTTGGNTTTGGDTTTGGNTTTGGDTTTGGNTTDTGTATTTGGCIPTEDPEVTCDNIDNDCNGFVDDVDIGGDGFCDCLDIGIIGNTGFMPTSDFEAWLESKGTSVTRTLLANPGAVVDDALLADYDLLLVDRIERELTAPETAAIESFVKDDGKGVITLIGYNFDNNDPAPERARANTALAGFGLAYTGPYLHAGGANNVTPTFDPAHPISAGIVDVNYHGGMAMVDNGAQGTSEIFATVPDGDAGLAHQTANDGGRVIVWGDEWLTFDADWAGYADVEQFWKQMVEWAGPREYCVLPQ